MIGLSSFISCACETERSFLIRCLVAAVCRLMASGLGLMSVLYPRGVTLVFLPEWVFPTRNWRTVKPRKSNPTWPWVGVKVWVIFVFFGESVNPMPASHWVMVVVA